MKSLQYLFTEAAGSFHSMPLQSLRTGVHIVSDVFCIGCNERVGWYYVKASDGSQKYKEGKLLAYLSVCHNRCFLLYPSSLRPTKYPVRGVRKR